jgi:hypothetical protein
MVLFNGTQLLIVIILKRAWRRSNGDLPEEDFWTEITCGLPVTRAWQ